MIGAQLLDELQRCHWKEYEMPEPVQVPLLACSVLPIAAVPLMDGGAVLVGVALPGGVFESAVVMERVTRVSRTTNVVTARDRRLMASPSALPWHVLPLEGVFRSCADLGKQCADVVGINFVRLLPGRRRLSLGDAQPWPVCGR